MGVPCLTYLAEDKIWRCKHCGAHLAVESDLMSNDFVGKFGQAKLFHHVSNVSQYDRHKATMRTGTFLVDLIKCQNCESYVGWTYIKSYTRNETYKEGKYILEVRQISKYDDPSGLSCSYDPYESDIGCSTFSFFARASTIPPTVIPLYPQYFMDDSSSTP